jgi:hypothetical protein
MKTAIVIPINKTGIKTSVNDYRPVSILTIFNKIIEKIIHKDIYDFVFNEAKIIFNRQYGFRKKCGTETAAMELVDEIRLGLDNKKIVTAVSMDIRKAFDLVNKKKLLHALNLAGIRGKLLTVLESYLTNRKQSVKINNAISDTIDISHGVVQGGVLGSLLFIIFFNFISYIPLNGKIFLYADDIILLNFHEKQENIEHKIAQDMNHIMKFLNDQLLFLNKDKTNFIIFHNPQMKVVKPDQIFINSDLIIKRVESIKYLGLIMDENLKWNFHYENLERKLASTAGILWKLRNKLPVKTKKLIYNSLFETHINYLATIHGTADNCVVDRLQKIQNQALRNVFNVDKRMSRVEMYTHNVQNCLPIRAINYVNTAAFVFSKLRNTIHSNIKFNKVSGNTRANVNGRLVKPASKSVTGKKRICSYAVNIFNNIGNDIKNLPHMHSFKWALKCTIRNVEFITTCLNGEYIRTFINT